MPTDIRNETREALLARLAGEPAYRVDQVLGWVWQRRAMAWDEMTNVPRPLRERLAAELSIGRIEPVRVQGSRDTTRKFLWRLHDGAMIESVLIPANPALYGDAADRHTLCVSTQVGCAYGCRFCASGLDGWKRNLAPWEIAGQVLAVERWAALHDVVLEPEPPAKDAPAASPKQPRPPAPGVRRMVNNLVIMGMGEPMANYDNLMVALRALNAPWGGGIGARKITISTSGVVPGIRRLASEPEQFQLAISLHGATDDVRGRIMPVNRKYPLRDLVAACSDYVARRGRMITLEYILIEGVNDDVAMAAPLVAIARQLRAKVNLIPYNAVEGLEWRRPGPEACRAFADAVEAGGVTTTLRMEKGHDIDAACGQLRLRTERDLAAGAPAVA